MRPMLSVEIRPVRRIGSVPAVLVVLVVLVVGAAGSGACGKNAAPQEQSKQSTPPQEAKRYPLKGRILAVKAATNALTIDGDDIPGFMSAMTMDYSVRSAQSLTGLSPRDEITADVVVPADGTPYVENIVVTKNGSD
jgi:Cu/Ag efflux protein CusF